MPERIEKIAAIIPLLDAYGKLLSEKQHQALSLLYEEDFSLAEIALTMHSTRQAAHDLIRRGEALLHDFETKLQLVSERRRQEKLLKELDSLLAQGEIEAGHRRRMQTIVGRLLPPAEA